MIDSYRYERDDYCWFKDCYFRDNDSYFYLSDYYFYDKVLWIDDYCYKSWICFCWSYP